MLTARGVRSNMTVDSNFGELGGSGGPNRGELAAATAGAEVANPLAPDQVTGGGGGADASSVSGSSDTRASMTVDEIMEKTLDDLAGRYTFLAMCALGLANSADSAEMMVISFIMPELDFSETLKGVLSGAMFAGMLVGGVTSGLVADRIGRRPCLLGSMVINLLFGLVIVIFPDSWEWIFGCRVLAGVGVGGTVPVMFTMAAEFSGPKYRGRFITTVCSFWMFGGMFVAGACWLMLGKYKLHWTYACYASQVPNLISMLMIFFFLDETPHFLYNQGRTDAAVKVLRRMARWSHRQFVNPFENDTGRRLSRNIAQVDQNGEVVVPRASRVLPARSRESYGGVDTGPIPMPPVVGDAQGGCNPCKGLGDMFKPKLRLASVSLIVMWATLSFGWYGIILWIPRLFKDYDAGFGAYEEAFMVQMANLPGNVLSVLLVDYVGRNRLLSISMFGSSVICLVMGFQKQLTPIVVLACVYNGVSIIGWGCLSCVSSESFPTYLRSTAVGFLSGTGRVASGLSQVAFGLMFHYKMPASMILFSGAITMSLGAFAAWYLDYAHARQQRYAPVVDEQSPLPSPRDSRDVV